MFLILALALPCLIALGLRARPSLAHRGVLETRYVPVVVGIAWAALSWVTWGSWHPMPLDHDEVAYLMQAEIFAHGRWASPAPPLPDFFGQAHVLVTPVLASKYPPGHSLLLALGALVGVPALAVFALNAVRVGLVFALARRLADPVTALLTCAFMFLGDTLCRFSASYYSQTTSGALLMVAWYCLWRWHDGTRRGWLLGTAAALGWCAITRPWSAVAFAVPIAVVVLRDVRRSGRWRDLALATAAGACVVAILPLWARGTLGDWRRAPLTEYARDYMPFDFPHFGAVNVAPRLTPPPDVAAINVGLREAERQHTLANLPQEAVERAKAMWTATWTEPVVFAAFTVLGLLVLPPAAWLGVATVLALFVAYLAHPTWAQWTVYYFEVMPVLILVGALGFTSVLRLITGELKLRERHARIIAPRAAIAGLVGCVLLLAPMVMAASNVKLWLAGSTMERRRFEWRVANLPAKEAIVFVRYGPQHSPHRSLVVNRPDWPTAHAWIVYDRGAANVRLRALAPERAAYLYDQASDRFLDLTSRSGRVVGSWHRGDENVRQDVSKTHR